jgi:hypothetical protein
LTFIRIITTIEDAFLEQTGRGRVAIAIDDTIDPN